MFFIKFYDNLKKIFSADQAGFDKVMALQGAIYREVESRKTLRFEVEGAAYFAKLHFGIGLREFLKNSLQAKKAVLGALPEYRAILHLEKAGVRTMTVAGVGLRGVNPLRQESFLITQELVGFNSVSDILEREVVSFALKIKLIHEIADLIRRMHLSGLNHRDCYLCHVYASLKDAEHPELALIDLHRSQVRKKVPLRWVIKDIAGLYFSAMDFKLSRRDFFRFMKTYQLQSLRACLQDPFWQVVASKARLLYKKEAHKRV